MSEDKMDWKAIEDLLYHTKVMQTRFPLMGKPELFIPIELMRQALEYAKKLNLDVELKDLDDFSDV